MLSLYYGTYIVLLEYYMYHYILLYWETVLDRVLTGKRVRNSLAAEEISPGRDEYRFYRALINH